MVRHKGESKIFSLEEPLLKIGKALATQIALNWFNKNKADGRRGNDLSRLVQDRFPVRRKQRDIFNSLYEIEDEVAKQLDSEVARNSYWLPENERVAAIDAVSDTLEKANLSDTSLFETDLEPEALAKKIRSETPIDVRGGLSEQGERLYNITLSRSCVALIHLVRELPEFNPSTAVEALQRLTDALCKLDEVLSRIPISSVDAPSGTDQDEAFRHRYLTLIGDYHDHVEVAGLTTHNYEPRTTLSVAYLSLSATTDTNETSRRRTEWQHSAWFDDTKERSAGFENLRVENALAGSRRTILRGEAGAGKSTLLQWLAVNSSRGSFEGQLADWNGCIPFIVKLRDFAGKELPRGDGFIAQVGGPITGPIPSEWVHRQLVSGRALLLVDGVDELLPRDRERARKWLINLLIAYPDIRVVVTSRPTAINTKWISSFDFRSVMLESMKPSDVQMFLSRWHRALLDSITDPNSLPCPPDEIHDYERALLTQLQSRPHIRSLAKNPLLCAMLCALNLDRRSRLPKDRSSLYTSALEMLLERRDADRNVAAAASVQISPNEKITLLQALAWWLNENGRSQMSWSHALDRIGCRVQGMPNVHYSAEVLLNHLLQRSGVIRTPIAGQIDFVHRTFQEFLSAKEAVERDSIDLLVNRARSDLWRETVLMACAQASPGQRDRLLRGLLEAADKSGKKAARKLRLLTAACKETATHATPSVLTQIDECIRTLVPPRRTSESRSLATVGETIIPELPADPNGLSAAKAAACIRTVAIANGPDAISALARYAGDPRRDVQAELINAWSYFDPARYAKEVLAEAPLIDGAATVFDPRQIRNTAYLQKLEKLTVDLVFPTQEELQSLVDCDNLHDLSIDTDELNLESLNLKESVQLLNIDASAVRGLASLKELSNLSGLIMRASEPFSNLDFLGSGSLRVLFLGSLDDVEDYSPLGSYDRIDNLGLTECKNMFTLDPIKNIQVTSQLGLFGCPAEDLAGQVSEYFPGVRYLHLVNSSISDLSPLVKLPLKTLAIGGCALGSLAPLSSISSIEMLSLNGCPNVLDLSPLIDLPELRSIDLRGAEPGFDLSPLANSDVDVLLSSDQEVHGDDKLANTVRLPRF